MLNAPDSARERWLADRRKGLCSSEIAAVLRIPGAGSIVKVWADKVLPPEPGRGHVFESRSFWGKALERAIAEAYGQLTGQEVHWFGEVVFTHPRIGWWKASPDAAVESSVCDCGHIHAGRVGATPAEAKKEPCGCGCPFFITFGAYERVAGSDAPVQRTEPRFRKLVEVKNRGNDQRWKWGEPGTDQIPEATAVQVFHQLGALDVETADIIALFGGNDGLIYTLARDRGIEELIEDVGGRFWREHVLANVMPPPDGSEAARRAIVRRFPKALAGVREATPEEVGLLTKWRKAHQRAALLEAERDLYANQLCVEIAEAKGLTWDDEAGSHKAYFQEIADTIGEDWQAVARAIAEEHTGSVLFVEKFIQDRIADGRFRKVVRRGGRQLRPYFAKVKGEEGSDVE